jgi:hypothetical protein
MILSTPSVSRCNSSPTDAIFRTFTTTSLHGAFLLLVAVGIGMPSTSITSLDGCCGRSSSRLRLRVEVSAPPPLLAESMSAQRRVQASSAEASRWVMDDGRAIGIEWWCEV